MRNILKDNTIFLKLVNMENANGWLQRFQNFYEGKVEVSITDKIREFA
jgi:hypothetical protein